MKKVCKKMNRLTKRDGQGNWQLKGLPWEDINEGRIITKNRSLEF